MDNVRTLHQRIKLEPEPTSFAYEATGHPSRWSNKDLDPVPQERKKWEWYHVAGFWIAEGFNTAVMEVPSSAVALGLNPGLAIVACLVGNILVAVPVAANGYIGSKWSLNFPVLARAPFGMIGAYLAMIIRGVVCVIYYGVQSSLGGNAVQAMLEAIWPSFKSWHINALPASSAITAPGILSFSIFWLLQLPFLWLSVPAIRWVFIVKVVIMPFFWVALFTWGLTAAHGWGPLFSIPSTVKQTSGWTLGYAFCYTISASIGANATFAVNMPDITRYAHNPKRAWQTQAVALPVAITLTELLGTVFAASSQVIYGQVLWNPLTVVLLWNNRAGKFFAGLLFAFANLATNVSGNSIPFANDLTGLFPGYVNIRRGQLVCAVLAFAICPWLIEAKAARFLAFLNGYSVFLGPLVGILMVDYFLVRRGHGLSVYDLYRPGKANTLYWYVAGVNPRAIAALVVGIVPLLPGLINQVNPTATAGIGRGILDFYSMVWLDGVVLAGLSYYLLFLAFPHSVAPDPDAGRYLEQNVEASRHPGPLVGVQESPGSGSGISADEKTGVEKQTNAI